MDHAFTDVTDALNEGRDWEPGAGEERRMVIDSSGNGLVCVYKGCKSSGKVFKRRYELARHKLIHFPNKKLICLVHECKLRKKAKFHTRNDKYREHIDAHGELALFCCPIPRCKSGPVRKAEFGLHVAKDHDVFERFQIKSLLSALRIDCEQGDWACPVICDFHCSSKRDMEKHLGTHDLSERLTFLDLIELVALPSQKGRATCPICHFQICDADDWINGLLSHIQNLHTQKDQIAHGNELAKLLGHLQGKIWVITRYPTLYAVIKAHMPAKTVSTLPEDSNPGISSAGASTGSSGSPKATGDGVLEASADIVPCTEGFVYGSFMDVGTQQIRAPQTCMSMDLSPNLQGFMQSQTFMTPHSFMTTNTAQVPQECSHPQTFMMPQTFMNMNMARAPEAFAQPQMFMHANVSQSPQVFMAPHTFMTTNIAQAPQAPPSSIPPVMPQTQYWPAFQNMDSNWEYNQYRPSGQLQWSGMNLGDNLDLQSHQSSPLPVPGNTDFLWAMQFNGPGREDNQ